MSYFLVDYLDFSLVDPSKTFMTNLVVLSTSGKHRKASQAYLKLALEKAESCFFSLTHDPPASLKGQLPFSEVTFFSHTKPAVIPAGRIIGITFENIHNVPFRKGYLLFFGQLERFVFSILKNTHSSFARLSFSHDLELPWVKSCSARFLSHWCDAWNSICLLQMVA